MESFCPQIDLFASHINLRNFWGGFVFRNEGMTECFLYEGNLETV